MKRILSLLAVLLFSFSSFSQDESLSELKERLEQHVAFLASDSLEGRGLGTRGKELAMKYIAAEFDSIGLEKYNDEGYFQPLDLRIGLVRVPAVNIVGYLTGSDPALKDEYVVIGAHYDHLGYIQEDDGKKIFHGADDNASGVAVMIELARFFSMNRDLSKRSIIFVAFDAEESGLLGSALFFKDNSLVDTSDVRMMFSLDMVGMYKSFGGVDMLGIGTLKEGEALANEIANRQGIRLKSATVETGTGTDSWPFSQMGIPAVHVFTGIKSPYHKPEDTFEKLDYEGMSLITKYLADLIIELNALPEIESSGGFARQEKAFAISFKGGITAGAGSSRNKIPEEYFNLRGIFSYNAGFFLQMNLGRRLTLQPEVLFQGDGSESPDGILRRQSIIVPVNLHINVVNQYGGEFKFYPFLGGYYLNSFNVKEGGENLDLGDDISKDEWGMNLGIGADIKGVQLKFTIRRSLTDLGLTSDYKIFPSMWFISAGYLF